MNGVIAEKTDSRDLLGSDFTLPRAPRGTDSFIKNGSITYNQKEVDDYSCTIHGAMTAYSALTGYKFSLEDRKELWARALELGAIPKLGWYILDAVKLIAKYVKEKGWPEVAYRRYEVGSDSFKSALRLGYVPVIGIRTNSAYRSDRDDDGILENYKFSGDALGHCLTCAYEKGSIFKGYKLTKIIDSYPQRSTNIYKVPNNNWTKLVINRTFFSSSYIYHLI